MLLYHEVIMSVFSRIIFRVLSYIPHSYDI